MRMEAGLPSFPVLAAALRSTTERLALELASAAETAPAWTGVEWNVARAVAAMQGITVLLANRLRWEGPSSWQDFLATQRRQALQRDARIESLLAQLDVALHAARVGCVALKGSALRRRSLYRPGERPMGDVDLLARHADADRVTGALHSIGYECSFDMRRHRVFAPRSAAAAIEAGEHPDNPLKIEVHFRIAEPLPVYPVDISAGILREDCGFGLRDYASARELFRHLLLHAAGNMRAHALRQIQLHDISLLAGRLTPEDWESLRNTPQAGGGAWWMWPVLELTRRYYPAAMPRVIDDFRELSPRWLRRTAERMTLSELSWSNLGIAAFPGIQWARSAGEALRFVRQRVIPARVALDELQVLQVAQPAMMQVPWYGLSHARRIARWVFSSAPRVQTLVSVRAAMKADEPA
jgi:hypothetical protein